MCRLVHVAGRVPKLAWSWCVTCNTFPFFSCERADTTAPNANGHRSGGLDNKLCLPHDWGCLGVGNGRAVVGPHRPVCFHGVLQHQPRGIGVGVGVGGVPDVPSGTGGINRVYGSLRDVGRCHYFAPCRGERGLFILCFVFQRRKTITYVGI